MEQIENPEIDPHKYSTDFSQWCRNQFSRGKTAFSTNDAGAKDIHRQEKKKNETQYVLHLTQKWASFVAQIVKNHLQCKRPRFNLWVGKIPWIRKWQPTPVSLPGEFYGQRRLVGYSPRGHKETDTDE